MAENNPMTEIVLELIQGMCCRLYGYIAEGREAETAMRSVAEQINAHYMDVCMDALKNAQKMLEAKSTDGGRFTREPWRTREVTAPPAKAGGFQEQAPKPSAQGLKYSSRRFYRGTLKGHSKDNGRHDRTF